MKRLIFSIFINIEDELLDNPATFDDKGNLLTTDKSKIVKQSFEKHAMTLITQQASYAFKIGVDYICVTDPKQFASFMRWFKMGSYPFSKYDIINFYKHYLMREYADQYDQVCYVDLDIVFNTEENIFDNLPVDSFFCVPNSNEEAEWGKKIAPKYYNTCIRNPATKYWNTRAMLAETDQDFDVDVYNTGIMVANSVLIQHLDYFTEFDKHIDLMTKVKHDPESMYPNTIQRVFNYDNETLFAYLTVIRQLPVYHIPKEWHWAIRGADYDKNAKVFHVIDKIFERFFK